MQNNYYNNIRNDVLSLIPGGSYKKILEAGGGNFSTLFKLNKLHQAEIWGVDIHPCDRANFNFIQGSLDSPEVRQQIPDQYFDLIIANDVVEHLQDTKAFMSFVKQKLRPGGYLVTSVPNIRQIRTFFYVFMKGTFPRQEAGLFDRTHLRWFCRRDVINLAAKADLEMTNYKGVGRLLPKSLNKSLLAEFLALQFIFVFKKQITDGVES